MELTTESRAAQVWKNGSDTFTATAGQSVRIETSPDGQEILNEAVPAGKTWTIIVNVRVVET